MILFLDTEWADADARELVSMGLVSEDDRFSFYAEIDPLPLAPTEFVRSVVYPLLRAEPGVAASASEFRQRLRRFVATVAGATSPILIGFDSESDWRHFVQVLGPEDELLTGNLVRPFDLNSLGAAYVIGLEQHFELEPAARRKRHHALVDAYAARRGYQWARRVQAPRP